MAKVLIMSSNITCPHSPGKVTVSSSTKLTVNGSAALLKTSIAGKQVGGCTNPTDNSGNKTCTSVVAVTKGEATKLTFNNQPVMLDDLAGTTDGAKTNSLSASANQSKLTAT
jgi:hypothetical protein